jgi:uncharacterized protein (DUF2384 family)
LKFVYHYDMATLPNANQSSTSQESSKTLEETATALARYQKLVDRAKDAFGDEIKASRWLSLPNEELEGQTPLEVVQANGYDLEPIEAILMRMENGIDY